MGQSWGGTTDSKSKHVFFERAHLHLWAKLHCTWGLSTFGTVTAKQIPHAPHPIFMGYSSLIFLNSAPSRDPTVGDLLFVHLMGRLSRNTVWIVQYFVIFNFGKELAKYRCVRIYVHQTSEKGINYTGRAYAYPQWLPASLASSGLKSVTVLLFYMHFTWSKKKKTKTRFN